MGTMNDPSLTLSLINCGETLRISVPTVLDASLGRLTRLACDERLSQWSRRIVNHSAVALNIQGRENFDTSKAYIVMSNHQSLYDIPLLFHVLGSNLRMLTKKELFAIPIWGAALRESGFVAIDRSDKDKARTSFLRARELLASGTSVWIAPEGTRSRDGELLPFKMGGFHLALETGWPILPVCIRGSRHILAAKAIKSVAGVAVSMTIHRPIVAAAFGLNSRPSRHALAASVRAALASGLASGMASGLASGLASA